MHCVRPKGQCPPGAVRSRSTWQCLSGGPATLEEPNFARCFGININRVFWLSGRVFVHVPAAAVSCRQAYRGDCVGNNTENLCMYEIAGPALLAARLPGCTARRQQQRWQRECMWHKRQTRVDAAQRQQLSANPGEKIRHCMWCQ
jgi:hypothetical protein